MGSHLDVTEWIVPQLREVTVIQGVIGLAALIIIIFLYLSSTQTQVPPIISVPTAPNALPFIGHLHHLGGRLHQNDSTIYTSWSRALSSPLIQLRHGSRRVLIISSFRAIRSIFTSPSTASALIDRPAQPGFAEHLDYDLSGAPMTPSIRRVRKAAMRALGKPLWGRYYGLLEPSAGVLVRNVLALGEGGRRGIDVYDELRRMIFDLVLSLTYGARQHDANDPATLALIKCINDISSVRASTRRYRDYVPLLRFLIPDALSGNIVITTERERQVLLDALYADLQARVAKGEDVQCIVTGLVADNMTEPEIHGTCKALLQAAPDSTASSVYMGIAWLCSAGRAYQSVLHRAILATYAGDAERAWEMAFREEAVEEAVALTKEVLRFWTTTPFGGGPREAVRDFVWEGVRVRKGTAVLMNAQEANHDVEWFGPTAGEFDPRRYMGKGESLPHLTFGAGARVCPAVGISNRIIYAMLVRLILAFEMDEATEPGARRPNIDPIHFSDVHDSIVAMPKKFDCLFKARDEEWLKQMLEREVVDIK